MGMVVYTDGACFPNPGRGGWAWILVKDNQVIDEEFGSEEASTNNRMEYLAAIKAIERHGPVIQCVFTDSQLLVNTCMTWRHKWKKNKWKKEIKNLDLVLRLSDLLDRWPIAFVWVKGHSGIEFNEIVDELANEAAVRLKPIDSGCAGTLC